MRLSETKWEEADAKEYGFPPSRGGDGAGAERPAVNRGKAKAWGRKVDPKRPPSREGSNCRHAETSLGRSGDFPKPEHSGGCGEQQELCGHGPTRRWPSTMKLGGDVLRVGDGSSHSHRPATAGAHGDVDAKDAG